MNAKEIFNFIQIDDRIATSGQPTEEQFAAAGEDGYTAIINLAPYGTSDPRLPRIDDEAGTVRRLGMAYRYIPVDWGNPRVEDFTAFAAAMDEFRDDKLLIHCAANFRVTAFFSLYAMKQLGWSREQADRFIARIWESQPGYAMDEVWRGFIERIRAS